MQRELIYSTLNKSMRCSDSKLQNVDQQTDFRQHILLWLNNSQQSSPDIPASAKVLLVCTCPKTTQKYQEQIQAMILLSNNYIQSTEITEFSVSFSLLSHLCLDRLRQMQGVKGGKTFKFQTTKKLVGGILYLFSSY